MMMPKPTEREKKICPAASSQISGLASASKKRLVRLVGIPHVAQAVDQRSARADRIGRAQRQHADQHDQRADDSAGMANLQNHSMPLFRPR